MKLKNSSLAILGVTALAACGGGGSSGTATDATTTTTTTTDTTVSSDVTSLKDLKLTGVLAITLPDSIKANGTAASLALNGTKSFEACKLRQELKEGLSNIAQVASTFCFLENDSSIEFGKKYSIDFSSMMPAGGGSGGGGDLPDAGEDGPPAGGPPAGGPPVPGLRLEEATATPSFPTSIQLWIDNSTAGKLSVYFCEDKKLTQFIEVSGAKEGVAKGRVVMKQALSFGDFSMSFHRAMNFDAKYTKSDTTSLTVKELISTTSTAFGTEKARRLLSLLMPDTGVSKVMSSFSGNFQGSDNSFASVGAFDKDFGSVIAKGQATDPDSDETIDFSTESYFDGKSYVVDPAAYPTAFGTGGKVALDTDAVPGFLGASFTPDDFPADAWDCTGTTDLTMNPSASTTSSCDASWDELGDEDCFGDVFAEGDAVTIDETAQVDAEQFEGFSEDDATAELRHR